MAASSAICCSLERVRAWSTASSARTAPEPIAMPNATATQPCFKKTCIAAPLWQEPARAALHNRVQRLIGAINDGRYDWFNKNRSGALLIPPDQG